MNNGTITNTNVNITAVYISNSEMPVECGAAVDDIAASREELNNKYGAEAVNQALQHLMFEALKEAVMAHINDQEGPEALQDEGVSIIESASSGHAEDLSPEMLEEVKNSAVGQHAMGIGMAELIEQFAEDQSKREFDRVDEATGVTEKKKGGGAGGAEGGSGGSGGAGGSSGTSTGGAKNWLEALAIALAEIQDKFLTAALEATDAMAANADGATSLGDNNSANGSAGKSQEEQNSNDSVESGDKSGDDKSEFLKAQAQYSANIQMFTTMANQTATSIKSIGEGLSAISRKQ